MKHSCSRLGVVRPFALASGFFSLYVHAECGVQGLNKPKTSQWSSIKSTVPPGFKSRAWESRCSRQLPQTIRPLAMICFKDRSRMVQKPPSNPPQKKKKKSVYFLSDLEVVAVLKYLGKDKWTALSVITFKNLKLELYILRVRGPYWSWLK